MILPPALFDFRISTFLFPLLAPALLPSSRLLHCSQIRMPPACRPLMCADAAAVARFICRMYVCDRERELREACSTAANPTFQSLRRQNPRFQLSVEKAFVIGLSL